MQRRSRYGEKQSSSIQNSTTPCSTSPSSPAATSAGTSPGPPCSASSPPPRPPATQRTSLPPKRCCAKWKTEATELFWFLVSASLALNGGDGRNRTDE